MDGLSAYALMTLQHSLGARAWAHAHMHTGLLYIQRWSGLISDSPTLHPNENFLNKWARTTQMHAHSLAHTIDLCLVSMHSALFLSVSLWVCVYSKPHSVLRQCVCACVYFMYDLYLNCKQCSDNSTCLPFALCFSKKKHHRCRQTVGGCRCMEWKQEICSDENIGVCVFIWRRIECKIMGKSKHKHGTSRSNNKYAEITQNAHPS